MPTYCPLRCRGAAWLVKGKTMVVSNFPFIIEYKKSFTLATYGAKGGLGGQNTVGTANWRKLRRQRAQRIESVLEEFASLNPLQTFVRMPVQLKNQIKSNQIKSNLHARGQTIWAQVIVGNLPHMYKTVQTRRATSDSQCRSLSMCAEINEVLREV